jgi:hypothetical protein
LNRAAQHCVPGPTYRCPIDVRPLSPTLSRTPPLSPGPAPPRSHLSVTPVPRRVAHAPPPFPVRVVMVPHLLDGRGPLPAAPRCGPPREGPLLSLPLHPPRGRAHWDPLPLSFSADLKGSPRRRAVSSFPTLSLSTLNHPHATPPASLFASRPSPTIGALLSAMNPEPPLQLRPLSVCSTLPSSPSSIDRPYSLLVVPQCCRTPLGHCR